MRTIIEFKDGHIETIEDTAPNFDTECDELDLVEEDMTSHGDTVTISLLKKVTWEND